MSTISAVIDPSPDGTLHLPVPEELRGCRVAITATLHAVTEAKSPLRVSPEVVALRRQLLEELRNLGGLSDAIPDPAAWQREMREDRPLPGRD